ncbi:MAG TPA: Ig-like domain-containing protein [Longimicrobium sp.]|jgi:hypothetical protein|uniref:Ig-like domain-containing protein n=1 Tax=Longimicrobium sp. TaxID=2029185 RepID=UPI002EDA600D
MHSVLSSPARRLCPAVVIAALAACSPSSPSPTLPLRTAVQARPVASVVVAPASARLGLLPAGRSLRLTATLQNADKETVTGRRVTWASSDPSSVAVDETGVVRVLRPGRPVRITATAGGVTGAAMVTPDVYRNDFEDQAPGPLTVAALNAGWNRPFYSQGVQEGRVTVVGGDLAYGGGRSLRVAFPRGGVGPAAGGALWVLPLGGTYTDLYASYRVRFAPGFQFVLGGKLPGLAGGAGNTGGSRPTGRDGWSGRAMWSGNGRLLQYVYHPEQPNEFGQSLNWTVAGKAVTAIPGRWYHFETRVVMNTPGRHDGVVQGWVDGVQVLDQRGMRFRDVDTWAIDAFHMTTFFGGSEASWAPVRDEFILFDDVVISPERNSPLVSPNVPARRP